MGSGSASIGIVRATFRVLDLLINKQKSTLVLVQRIEFTGAVLDSAKSYLAEAKF